jgi:transposase
VIHCTNPSHAQLESQVLRMAAEKCQLLTACERLTSELAVCRLERDEARVERDAACGDANQLRHTVSLLKSDLAGLVKAVRNQDERLHALVRREFGASSERLIADETFIPEVLATLLDQGLTVAVTPDNALSGTPQDTTATATATAAAATTSAATAPPAAASTATKPTGKRRRPANAGGRAELPADIERRHTTYVPPDDHPALRHAASFQTIGTTEHARWHITKPDIYIEVITCPIVRLTLKNDAVSQQTVSPPAIMERGQVSDAVLVQSAVDRVVDHLPAYRQEQRGLRMGYSIPRSKLCRWHMELGEFLEPIAEKILAEVCSHKVLGIDDTTHRLQVKDRTTCKTTRIWAVTAESGIYYMYTPTREGCWIAELLKDFCGGLMGDAYSGHNLLLNRFGILAFFCWAHVRRKFWESMDTVRQKVMLDLIAELYAIEKQLTGGSPHEREAHRALHATPVLARIKATLDLWATDVLPQSGIGRAVSYTLKLWPSLENYVYVGEAHLDNNRTERGMRPVAMHRKNSLFSGSERGAQAYATLLTITQTALIQGLNPVTYMNDIIEDMHFARRPMSELTPQAYAVRMKEQTSKAG